jgi:hypothetical protein
VPDDQPTVVVDEPEKDSLAAADDRPVQGVAGPPHVRRLGLEPTERLRWLPVGAGVQLEPHEVPLQGPFVR